MQICIFALHMYIRKLKIDITKYEAHEKYSRTVSFNTFICHLFSASIEKFTCINSDFNGILGNSIEIV